MRVLVVDDEPLARERIRDHLAKETDVEVVGEAADGHTAVEMIQAEKPDLVLLDVQMPELDGFEVLDQLETDEMPLVIFITAHDDHALRAFEVRALDYLLKPVDTERFQAAMASARTRLQDAKNTDFRKEVLDLLDSRREKAAERLVVKSEGRVVFVSTDEIDWIEAAGNYAKLHVEDDEYLIRETMIGLERKLDGKNFVRIHRSAIVNLERVREMQPLFHGEYSIKLTTGAELTLSRGYRDNLQKLLGDSL